MNNIPRFKYYLQPFQNIEAVAIYSLPLRDGHSDVSAPGLAQAGYAVPLTPDYKTWRMMVQKKLRCGRCWRTLRGTNDDFVKHSKLKHQGVAPYVPA
jgi:hypothetical protein